MKKAVTQGMKRAVKVSANPNGGTANSRLTETNTKAQAGYPLGYFDDTAVKAANTDQGQGTNASRYTRTSPSNVQQPMGDAMPLATGGVFTHPNMALGPKNYTKATPVRKRVRG